MPIDHVDTRALSSATGFYANAEDLTQYFSAYYFGNDRLISDESKRRMFRPVWVDEDDRTRGSNYGLGVFLENVGKRRLVGHSGGYQGHITNSLADPDNRIAVSVLTNALGSPVTPLVKTVYKLIDLAKGAQADPEKPATPAGVDLQKFSGRFVSRWNVYDVAVLGGRLYQVFPAELDPAKSAVPLTVIDAHTLRVDGGERRQPVSRTDDLPVRPRRTGALGSPERPVRADLGLEVATAGKTRLPRWATRDSGSGVVGGVVGAGCFPAATTRE